MAKVIKRFFGVPDGQHQAVWFEVGDEVPAGTDLERVAIEEGWCKAMPAPKNKALSDYRNKSGSASRQGRASTKKTSRRSKAKT